MADNWADVKACCSWALSISAIGFEQLMSLTLSNWSLTYPVGTA